MKAFLDTIIGNVYLILTITLVVIFFVYSLLDIFGVTHKYREKIPQFILLIICISLTELIFDRRKENQETKKSIEELQTTASSNHDLINKLESKNLIEKLQQVHAMSNPILESMFKDHINHEIQFFDNLLNNDYIIIDNVQQYYDYYSKSLSVIANLHDKKITVKAASVLSKNYLWKTSGELTPLEKSFKNFIGQGNKMERLFYVDDNVDSSLLKQTLDRQKSLGITVYTLNYEEYKNTIFNLDKPPLFAVFDCNDDNCKNNLAWEVTVDNQNRPTSFKYMKTIERCNSLIKIFDALKNTSSCKTY